MLQSFFPTSQKLIKNSISSLKSTTSINGYKPLAFFSKKDYYKILGQNKGANSKDVKKAFVKLAQQYHPDRNPSADAKEKFKDITEAYETLSNEKKKSMYDQFGMDANDQVNMGDMGGNPFGNMGGMGDFFNQAGMGGGGRGASFEDVFKDFDDFFGMGGMGGRSGRSERTIKGQDIFLNQQISFEEAVFGCQKEISYQRRGTCPTCNGSKCKPGTSPTKCGACGGKGYVNYRQGLMSIQMVCSKCKGTGEVIRNPCPTCKGTGVASMTSREKINIPKGINNGQNLRISSKGNQSENGGPAGDLIIKIAVQKDPYFTRDGFDIYTNAYISIPQAVLGTQIDVKTQEGMQKVEVKAGTEHGSKTKLRGKGVSKLAPNNHLKGDHYIVFKQMVPKNVSPEQKKIYEDLYNLEKNEIKKTG